MNDNILLIPIHVDALHLPEDSTVVEASADFSRLPYTEAASDKTRQDRNANTAFVSETVSSQPFQNISLTLQSGIHLHWALPDALVKASNTDEGHFPAVPNRWLVSCLNKERKLLQQWIIESNYLFPEDTPTKDQFVTVPLPYQPNRIGKPFRYMGKVWDPKIWQIDDEPRDYWENHWNRPLTAIGYGNPVFASLYANCRNIFGLYTGLLNTDQEIQYEVIGWYDKLTTDHLHNFNERFKSQRLTVYRQPLEQQFRYLGVLAWQALEKAKWITITGGRVNPLAQRGTFNLPAQAPSQEEIAKFLQPAHMRTLFSQDRLCQQSLIAPLVEEFRANFTKIWDALTHGNPDNSWLTPLNSTSTVAIIQTAKTLPEDLTKYWELLKDLLAPDGNRRLINKISFEAYLNEKQLELKAGKTWETLIRKNWIQPVSSEYAIIGPTEELIELSKHPHDAAAVEAILDYLGSKERKAFTSKHALQSQFPACLIQAVWKELFRVKMLETKIAPVAGDGPLRAIVSLSDDRWSEMYPVFAPLKAGLKQLLASPDNEWVLPKNRLSDRYGSDAADAIWNRLTDKNWISPLQSTDLAIVDKGIANVPVKARNSAQKTIGEFLADLTAASSVTGKAELDNLLRADISAYRLFHPHSEFSALAKQEFLNRFHLQNPEYSWVALAKAGWITLTEATCDDNQTDLPTELKPFQADLQRLLIPQSTVTRVKVTGRFEQLAEELWQQCLKCQWLSYDSAAILPETARQEMATSSQTDVEMLRNMVPPFIEQTDFIRQFGTTKAREIWTALNQAGIIKDFHTDIIRAPIPENLPATEHWAEVFKAAPAVIEHEVAIRALLRPMISRQRVMEQFGLRGEAIWRELLQKKWIVGVPTETGTLTSDEVSQNANPFDAKYKTYQSIAQQYLALAVNKAQLAAIGDQLRWIPGIELTQNALKTAFALDDATDLWNELISKQWLTLVDALSSTAILELEDKRQKLDAKYYHQLPALNLFLDRLVREAKLPVGLCCFGRVTLKAGSANPTSSLQQPEVEIAIANTVTEALSVKLAADINQGYRELLEDQLEAIQMERRMSEQQLDLGARFRELRHEKEFRPHDGGRLWQVVLEHQRDGDQNIESEAEVTLPESLAHELNALNMLQRQYNTALDQIKSLRSQLFTDWYKYQLCIYPPSHSPDDYPDIDLVKSFIERFDLWPLEQKLHATGRLELLKAGERIIGAKARFHHPEAPSKDLAGITLAGKLAAAINDMVAQIEKLKGLQPADGSLRYYALKNVPGPRFWEPAEPVVLLQGNLLKANLRHGYDGRHRDDDRLLCHLFDASALLDWPFARGNIGDIALRAAINTLEQRTATLDSIAFNICTEQPWHSLMLEWEVDFKALHDPTSLGEDNKIGYDPDFITKAFDLPENQPDFFSKAYKPLASKANSYYTHTSLLTSFAGNHFDDLLRRWLEDRLASPQTPWKYIQWPASNPANLAKQIENEFNLDTTEKLAHNTLHTAAKALEQLSRTDSMSQALSGFNQELLMRKTTMQLPVADPLAFTDDGDSNNSYAGFARRVAAMIGSANIVAPEPQNEFNPIRAGSLEIRSLRLIDTFGQTADLRISDIVSPPDMIHPLSPDLVNLKPRIAQAARLNFRWLSADHDDMEMNAHPASSPICGWLVPNNLDDSLLVYNGKGELLLIINEGGSFDPPPGKTTEDIDIIVNGIDNALLKNLVNYLCDTGSGDENFLPDFISGLNDSLLNIHPDYLAQHKDLALLMGRPVALVRISVGLELKGLPAVSHDWTLFRQEIEQAFSESGGQPNRYSADELPEMIEHIRETYDFTQVHIPVRIGDYSKLNDGLIGYWNKGFEANSSLIMPNSNLSLSTQKIVTEQSGQRYINATLSGKPQTLIALFDPTGYLHAATGILPTKRIDIPPDQYLSAVQRMQVTFLSAPLLMERHRLQVPVPGEQGYRWSWCDRQQDEWSETPDIDLRTFAANWQDIRWRQQAHDLWSFLLGAATGWLKQAEDQQTATIVEDSSRTLKSFQASATWKDWESDTDVLLQNLARTNASLTINLKQWETGWTAMRRKAATETAASLWAYLLQADVAWLQPITGGIGIANQADRKAAKLLGDWTGLDQDVEAILDDLRKIYGADTVSQPSFIARRIEQAQISEAKLLWDSLTGADLEATDNQPLNFRQLPVLQIGQGHLKPVNRARFSPDGNWVVTASDDHTAMGWKHTGEACALMGWFDSTNPGIGHTGGVNDVTFSPDGKTVVTAGEDKAVCIWKWDLTEGPKKLTLIQRLNENDNRLDSPVKRVVFMPDGKLYCYCGGSTNFVFDWDSQAGKVSTSAPTNYPNNPFFFQSPDNKACLWGWGPPAFGKIIHFPGTSVTVTNLADGDRIHFAIFNHANTRLVARTASFNLLFIDATSGKFIRVSKVTDVQPIQAEFHPNDSQLAMASQFGRLFLCEFKDDDISIRAEITAHEGAITALKYSPDGKRILTSGSDGNAKLWDSQDGKLLQVLTGHTKPIVSACFSPDGRDVLTASKDCTARLWTAQFAKGPGWLEGTGDRRHITDKALEGKAASFGQYQPYQAQIAEMLRRHGRHIEPARQEAGFHGQQVIREGWLVLRPEATAKKDQTPSS
jgi:WD40 repeat protein